MSLRSLSREGEWLTLPAEGRSGRTPVWPMGKPSPRERVIWSRLWRKPQAVAWEKFGMQDQVALYVRRWVEAEVPDSSPALNTLVRQLGDSLGVSLPGMRSLMWRLGSDEVAEKRAAAATPATGSVSARDRLRAVSGGSD
jgi:hypothetical protein